ncbi:unnamed protein product [Ixodes pacificus]
MTYEHLPIFECFAFSLFAALSALRSSSKKVKAGGKVEANYLGCKCRCMLLATDLLVKSRLHYGENVQDTVGLQLIPAEALCKPVFEPLHKTRGHQWCTAAPFVRCSVSLARPEVHSSAGTVKACIQCVQFCFITHFQAT